MPTTFLVTDAYGTHGLAVMRSLAALSSSARPIEIRAMVRHAYTPGVPSLVESLQQEGISPHASVTLTEVDFTDTASLKRAFADGAIHAVFLNTMPTVDNPRDEVRHARALLDAAAAAPSVRHLVYISVLGVADPGQHARVGGLPNWVETRDLGPADGPGVEKVRFRAGALMAPETAIAVDSAGRAMLKGCWGAKAQIEHLTRMWAGGGGDGNGNGNRRTFTILRPGMFMENFVPHSSRHFWPELATLRPPELRSAIHPDARMMLVDVADIGGVAAQALLAGAGNPSNDNERDAMAPQLLGKTINVGSQAVTLDEAAAVMSRVAGVPVVARHLSDWEAAEDVRESNEWRDMQAWSLEAQDCFKPDGLEDILGRKPVTFEAYLMARQEKLRLFLTMKPRRPRQRRRGLGWFLYTFCYCR